MFSLNDLPSLAWIFSTQATLMGYFVLFKPYFEKIIPPQRQNDIITYLKSYFEKISPSDLSLIIEDRTNTGAYNELYSAAKVYLSTKINHDAATLRISKERGEKNVMFYLGNGDVVTDVYEGIQLEWKFVVSSEKNTKERDFFELSFEKKHRDLVLSSYVPYVERKAMMITNERRILKMHSYSIRHQGWTSVNLEHPSTFDTMAMNEELKRSVMADLDRFIKRKDFYKRVGKAWKRGYLMYGPPGTGKTSLVAAMANYLNFDIYDLQLASIKTDADLRRLLLETKNSSILVIEDIDCSVDLPTRLHPKSDDDYEGAKLTLSGLLNCIDGLWSTCGDERIVIFTTNHKERLDPALLRPGRMDMHIYMGHCCFDGFKTLASNYLCLSEDDQHPLFPEVKRLISGEVLTPAQVAEELMKYEDADEALEALVRVLQMKRSGPEKCDGEFKKNMEKYEDSEEIKNIG